MRSQEFLEVLGISGNSNSSQPYKLCGHSENILNMLICDNDEESMGGYSSSQSVKKIIEINPYMLGTMAGRAADCQFWHRNLGIKCRLHELANKRRISVTNSSKLLANILYSHRGMGLSIGTMIVGSVTSNEGSRTSHGWNPWRPEN